MNNNFLLKIKNNFVNNPDLSFAFFLAVTVYVFFSISIENYASHNISFAILERFAVLGLIGLALTICIIAGEIDLSIGSNAALCAVIVVKLTDPIGAPFAMLIGISISTLIGFTQGFFYCFSKNSCNCTYGRNFNVTKRYIISSGRRKNSNVN